MKNNSGSVLVSVLAVSIILSILLMALFSAAAWSYKRGIGKLPKKQAHYTAMAGINTVKNIIRDEDVDGYAIADNDKHVKAEIFNFVKRGYDENDPNKDVPLEITLHLGDDFGADNGRCDLTVHNLPPSNTERDGDVKITASVLMERVIDENGQLMEDEEYEISLTMGWAFEWEEYETSLLDYLDYELDGSAEFIVPLYDDHNIRADNSLWYIDGLLAASFDATIDENPLTYVPSGQEAIFIYFAPGAIANLGNIGWESYYNFDVYVIITGEANITGLDGLSGMFTPYDIVAPLVPSVDVFPIDTDQEDLFNDYEWYVLHYENPDIRGAGANVDNSLTKSDIFDKLFELGIDYWTVSTGISFDETVSYSQSIVSGSEEEDAE